MSNIYSNIDDITELQIKIMQFVDKWVHEQKTPIPMKEIVSVMQLQGFKDFTIRHAITTLVKKGFMRRAVSNSNSSSFVQLRSVL